MINHFLQICNAKVKNQKIVLEFFFWRGEII